MKKNRMGLSNPFLIFLRKLPLFLPFLMVSCAYLQPYILDFNIVSPAEERQLGAQLQEEVGKQMKVIETPQSARVTGLGQRLVAQLPKKDFDYKFFMVEDSSPNAFTIPGGNIYVHTGLFKLVDTDDELAGVLAHEIGHAYERHPTKSISRAYGTQYLTDMIFGKEKAKAKNLVYLITQGGLLTRYSREDEKEADEIGYFLLQKAGISSEGLIQFLKKMQGLERGRTSLPFLSSHPPTPERIAHLESLRNLQTNRWFG